MSCDNQVWTFQTNADFERGVRWLDKDGEPYPLSAVRMQVRSANNPDGDPLLDSDTDGSVDLGATPDWWATIVFLEAVIAPLAEQTAIFDVVATRQIDGRTKVLVRGTAPIVKGVTR